jgi:hypothetical protein
MKAIIYKYAPRAAIPVVSCGVLHRTYVGADDICKGILPVATSSGGEVDQPRVFDWCPAMADPQAKCADSESSPSAARAVPVDRTEYFEAVYNRIGWWRGPFATLAARKEVREFWLRNSVVGASWLVERLATETHGDVLDGVANLLADIGTGSIKPIIGKLADKPTRDQTEVLLKALGWIEAPRDATIVDPQSVETTLDTYLSDKDLDIRAAACAATRILPRERAIALLTKRRRIERDSYVLEAIDEALRNRGQDRAS